MTTRYHSDNDNCNNHDNWMQDKSLLKHFSDDTFKVNYETQQTSSDIEIGTTHSSVFISCL